MQTIELSTTEDTVDTEGKTGRISPRVLRVLRGGEFVRGRHRVPRCLTACGKRGRAAPAARQGSRGARGFHGGAPRRRRHAAVQGPGREHRRVEAGQHRAHRRLRLHRTGHGQRRAAGEVRHEGGEPAGESAAQPRRGHGARRAAGGAGSRGGGARPGCRGDARGSVDGGGVSGRRAAGGQEERQHRSAPKPPARRARSWVRRPGSTRGSTCSSPINKRGRKGSFSSRHARAARSHARDTRDAGDRLRRSGHQRVLAASAVGGADSAAGDRRSVAGAVHRDGAVELRLPRLRCVASRDVGRREDDHPATGEGSAAHGVRRWPSRCITTRAWIGARRAVTRCGRSRPSPG